MELKDIFFNRVGRLRSGWRLAIYLISLFLAIGFTFAIAGTLWRRFGFAESNWGWVLQGSLGLGVATLLGWGYGRLFEDLPARALGWGFHHGWLRDWLKGSLVGALSLLLALVIVLPFGGFIIHINAAATLSSIGQTLLLSGLVFILAAAAEEAMFRGYPLQTMTRSGLAWAGVVLTALIFSAGHLDNPNVVPYFTFINTTLAGVWLAFAYLRTRSLWFPLGVHWAWNWMMGAVIGLPVSGIERLTPSPLLKTATVGQPWLTGGTYGIEGGAACTLALIVSTLFIRRTKWLSATVEMKNLTDHEIPAASVLPSVVSDHLLKTTDDGRQPTDSF